MAGLTGSAWRIYKESFGSIVGPFWLATAALTAATRILRLAPQTTRGPLLLLLDVGVPVFVLSIVLGVVSANLAAIRSGEKPSFLATWSRMAGRRGAVIGVALVPALVAVALALPPATRLLLLLLFNGMLGPPFVMQAAALEDHSVGGSFARARAVLSGNGARAILYLINVVAGTGLVGLFVGGAISVATRTTTLQLIALPVQTLVAGAILGFVAAFEFALFTHLAAERDPSRD